MVGSPNTESRYPPPPSFKNDSLLFFGLWQYPRQPQNALDFFRESYTIQVATASELRALKVHVCSLRPFVPPIEGESGELEYTRPAVMQKPPEPELIIKKIGHRLHNGKI